MKKSVFFIAIILLIICSFSVLVTQDVEYIDANFETESKLVVEGLTDTIFINKSPNLNKIVGFGNANKVKFSPTEDIFVVATSIGFEVYSYTKNSSNGNSTYEGSIEYTLLKRYVTSVAVNDFDYGEEGNEIYAALSNGEIYKIDLENLSSKRIGTHGDNATAISYIKNGTLATGGSDYKVRIWENNQSWVIAQHKDIITSIDTSPDKENIVSGSHDTNVIYSHIPTSTAKIIYNHDNWVNVVKFTYDGTYIVSGGSDNLINLYNVTNDQILYRGVHNSWVNGLDVSKNSKYIISGGDDYVSFAWEYKKGNNAFVELGEYSGAISSLSIEREGDFIAFTSEKKEVAFVNISSVIQNGGDNTMSQGATKISQYNDEIYAFDISELSKYAVTGYTDGNVLLWDTIEGKVAKINSHFGLVYSVDISPDLSKIASAGSDGKVKVWKGKNNVIEQSESGTEIYSLAFSPDSSILAYGTKDNVYLWNTNTGKKDKIKINQKSIISLLKYSHSGKHIVAALSNGSIYIINASTKDTNRVTKLGSFINDIAFSKNDSSILASLMDGTVRKFDVKTFAEKILTTKNGNLAAFTYDSAENSYLVVGVNDSVAAVNLRIPKISNFILTKHQNYVTSIKRSKDNFMIYSTGDDGVIKVTDLRKKSYYHNDTYFNLTMEVEKDTTLVAWSETLDEKITNNLIQDEETIYAIVKSKNIYAIDKNTSEQKWNYDFESKIHSTPAIVEDYFVFGSTIGKLILLDKSTGKYIDEIKLASENTAMSDNVSFFVNNKNIYFGVQGGELGGIFYGINVYTKEIFLEYGIEGNMSSTPVGDGQRVFIVSPIGIVSAFEYGDDTPVWETKLEGKGLFRMNKSIIHENKLIVYSAKSQAAASYIVALDIQTGEEIWSKEYDGTKGWPAYDNKNPYGYFVVDNGILKVNLNKGNIKLFITQDNITSDTTNVTVLNKDLFLTGLSSTDTILDCYDIESGELKWTHTESGNTSLGIALPDENNEQLYINVYNSNTGKSIVEAINVVLEGSYTRTFND